MTVVNWAMLNVLTKINCELGIIQNTCHLNTTWTFKCEMVSLNFNTMEGKIKNKC